MLVIDQYQQNAISLAIEKLKNGKVIAIPTDTVYGLAVDAKNFNAIENLYHLKKRDKNKPLAIFLKNIEQIKKLFIVEEITKKLIEKYLPGKLTIVAKIKDKTDIKLAKNLNEIDDNFLGFRVVDSFFIKKLFNESDVILAVTSANISGNKVASSPSEIIKIFPEIELVISGDILENSASTVVKINNSQLEIIRNGAIEIELKN